MARYGIWARTSVPDPSTLKNYANLAEYLYERLFAQQARAAERHPARHRAWSVCPATLNTTHEVSLVFNEVPEGSVLAPVELQVVALLSQGDDDKTTRVSLRMDLASLPDLTDLCTAVENAWGLVGNNAHRPTSLTDLEKTDHAAEWARAVGGVRCEDWSVQESLESVLAESSPAEEIPRMAPTKSFHGAGASPEEAAALNRAAANIVVNSFWKELEHILTPGRLRGVVDALEYLKVNGTKETYTVPQCGEDGPSPRKLHVTIERDGFFAHHSPYEKHREAELTPLGKS